MRCVKTTDMVITAVFAALISVFSLIALPMPSAVPLTLQTFIIALTGFTLGSVKGVVSVLVYIAVGTVGVPVFSGFQGGLAVLFGITGGFIVGFIPFTLFCGIKSSSKLTRLLLSIVGLLLCHICGILWLSVHIKSISSAFITASLPYLPKDIISISVAVLISEKIKVITQKFN